MRAKPGIRAAALYGAHGSSLPRKLRRSSTEAEAKLWRYLRSRQLGGAKFRRQQVLGPYVLDFYSHEHRLVIEVDGSQHFEEPEVERDKRRTAWLEARGLTVMRFTNRDVSEETEAVLEGILRAIEEAGPHPDPLPEGEGA